MFVCATNESKGQILAQRAKVASSLLSRLKGLLGTNTLPVGDGLWLKPCRSVHTWFMRYPIDVVFLNAEGSVLSGSTLAPWVFSRWERRAIGVLELPAGTLQKTQTNVGDQISFKPI